MDTPTSSPRTIETILDLKTGEQIEVEELLSDSGSEADIFQLRSQIEMQIQTGTVEKVCAFCKQPVAMRGRKRIDNSSHFFFVHPYNSGDCIRKSNSRLTAEQVRAIKYNGVKESDLHIKLKNLIGHYLELQLGTEQVAIDQVYRDAAISPDWRKPDVLAKHGNLQIAFELQLSTTFLSVIVSRTLFYRQHSIFLVWVFHKFSIDTDYQKFTQKDIFYNNQHNVFVFDQEALDRCGQEGKLLLKCLYQEFYIQGDLLTDKWFTTFVSIEDLTYDKDTGACYYKDSEKQRTELKAVLEKRKREEAAARQTTETERRRNEIAQRIQQKRIEDVQFCVDYLREYYRDHRDVNKAINPFETLDTEGRRMLNEQLQFTGEKKQFIADLFINLEKREFVRFICENDAIELDLNSVSWRHNTLLQYIIELESGYEFELYLGFIFKKGYRIEEADEKYIQKMYDKNWVNFSEGERERITRWATVNLFIRTKSKRFLPLLSRQMNFFLSIASLKQDMVMGFKFPSLKNVVHNMLEHRPQYSELFMRAIKTYNQWDRQVAEDRSGKFRKKVADLQGNPREQDREINPLVYELFPELDVFDIF
ncbi:MAG: hypothetical protein BGO69_09145 [Bacteroidetes bacterium 46-16]|nr:MAG: hypothetical protein BGO69_09145 [Bacteroidetes bacterium 46-16]